MSTRRRTLHKLFSAYLAVLILVSPMLPVAQQQVFAESISESEAPLDTDQGDTPETTPEPQHEPHQEESFQLQHDPITQINGNEDLEITASAAGAENVKMLFQTAEELEAEELVLTKTEENLFTVTIPKEKLWSSVFQYELSAEDKEGNTKSTDRIKATVTNDANTEQAPPLLITEITPRAEVDGTAAFEFVEIYNNTNQPFDLNDYHLVYRSGSGEEVSWKLTEETIISPQETVIVWIHNGNKQLAVQDFNAFYGTNLSDNNLLMIDSEGTALDGTGTVAVKDESGHTVVLAAYQDTDVFDNKGIIYQYPLEGNEMQKVGINIAADPANLISSQVPVSPLQVEEVNQAEEDSGDKQKIAEREEANQDSDEETQIEVGNEETQIEGNEVEARPQSETQEKLSVLNKTEEDVDPQTVPRLLITEITPDTVNMNGADAFEFIEIYNNSDQPINMNDYHIIYRYPSNTPDQIWDMTEDKVIGPGEAFIVWIKNSGNQDATLEDFAAEYGMELPESHVTTIESDGMANGSERTLIISDRFGNSIAEASYNDGGKKEVVADRGIVYKFPTEGNVMEKLGLDETVTPLHVYPEQVPSTPVTIETEASAPEIGEAVIHLNDGLIRVEVEVSSELPVTGAQVYFRQSASLDFQGLPLRSEDGKRFTVEIPVEVIWSDRVEYYFAAANEAGQATSEAEVLELPQAAIDYQRVPPLLITEVVPDTANVNGADAYEFIEIYNNTTEDISFNDYVLRYRYPNTGAEGDLLWGPPLDHEDITIPSGETIVLWIINGGNPHLTAEDFNQHYGTDLTEGNNLIKIYNNGMANGSERALIIATQTGDELSSAAYNDVSGVDDTVPDKGIFYRYPIDGSMQTQKISAGELDATPGTVMTEQVPPEKVMLPQDTAKPVIVDKTREELTSAEDFPITATITDDVQVKSVFLYYRTMDGADFIKVSLPRGENDNFSYTVYTPELIGRDQLEYYFVASDGKNINRSEVKRLAIENPNAKTGLRLNVEDQEVVAGEKVIKATTDEEPEELQMFIDQQAIADTFRAMENEAYFAFDVTETNIYFKNGVTMGDEILHIFDDTYNDFVTLTVPISADKLEIGENTISIRAGNKVSPFDEGSAENRDDFTIKNIRLVLSDGTIIYDPDYSNPNVNHPVGDSAGKQEVFDFTFTLEEEMFTSLAYVYDTAAVEDGEHEVKAVHLDEEVSATLITDNTAPEIVPTVEHGQEYKGEFVIDADVSDANGVKEVTAQLDGNYISLPYETSSALLSPGEHEAVFRATDQAGNVQEITVEFSVTEEHPWLPDWLKSTPDETSANLSVRVTDPTSDPMGVKFFEAYQYTAEDREHISIKQHASATEPPEGYMPEGEKPFTENELKELAALDGKGVSTESMTEFPYHRFDVTVDENVGPDVEIEIVWNGSSLEGRKVTMYAWNYATENWDELTSIIAGEEAFELVGSVQGADYLKDKKVSVIVQDQIAEYGEEFSFVWFTDTQYYSASYPWIYEEQVNWMVENRDALNIEYVFHTGDLVDVYNDFDQWKVADENMRVLDEAGIPYGVLAGNHDVDNKSHNYENYYRYFGADRFEGRPYYGDSYENNRGHYDLISVNGLDFIMVYMGWGVDQDGIDWINEVLAAHPNRIAILNFHEYLLATGSRSPIGDELFEKVVVPNENVKSVLSGHYHNAQTLVDEIDDDGDGTPDRTVYQLLADYQGGPEGGQGYLRILNFKMNEDTVHVQTYSPYLDDYNFYEPEDYPEKDEFAMEWDLEPQLKKVETDYVEVNVYTNQQIGVVDNVPSGETAQVTWTGLDPNREYFWYVQVTDDFGGSTRSPIWSFETVDGDVTMPEDPEKVDNTDENNEDPNGEDDNSDDETDTEKEGVNNEQVSDSDGKSPGDKEVENAEETVSAAGANERTGKGPHTLENAEASPTDKGAKTSGNSLPNTATSMFNYLLIGVTMLVAGLGILISKKRREKMA